MIWMDYVIEQAGKNFKVNGDWAGEVMGVKKDGTLNDHWLYKPGDLFRVDENGWMVKVSDLSGTVREK